MRTRGERHVILSYVPPYSVGTQGKKTTWNVMTGRSQTCPYLRFYHADFTDQVPCSQTQAIAGQHLPRIQSRVHSRKTDFALALSPEDARITELRRKALTLGLPLSHMSDAFTSTVPIIHPMEVKAASGNAEEAQLQVAVFHAATLSFLSDIGSGANARDKDTSRMPPTLGWTVIGHTWTVYIAWKDGDGNVTVRSPSLPRPLGTASPLELFSLLAVLKEGIVWSRGEFFQQYVQRLESCLVDHYSALEKGPNHGI